MKKLLNGILEFRQKCLPDYIENFGHLANGQFPDALLIACSDSRVAPNVFASTNPGDVFVIRNIGNIIPSYESLNNEPASSEAAAIEFSLANLPIKDIIICGHSDCAAMRAILSDLDDLEDSYLKSWLKQADCSLHDLENCVQADQALVSHNRLSQLNVLQQIKHLKSYPLVQKKIQDQTLRIHGWYFDIAKGDVYSFEEEFNRFILIDEEEVIRIIERSIA